MILCMPHWHVTLHGPVLHLVHSQPDEELGRVGSWDITLWRGAPSWGSHPELEHAALGIPLPALHASFIRHPWRFDIPDTYAGRKNTGELREFMVLTGGSWTLVLQFPRQAPAEVFAAVARGFHAQLVDAPILKVTLPAVSAPDAKITILPVFDDPVVAPADPAAVARAHARVRRLTRAARAAL